VVQGVLENEQFMVGLALEAPAWIAGSDGRYRRVAALLGAPDRMWQAMHTSLVAFRSLHEFHDACVSQVRARLGPEAFAAALRRGSELSPADAVAMALGQQRARVPTARPRRPPAPGSPAASGRSPR
jgi:hypothetical protein